MALCLCARSRQLAIHSQVPRWACLVEPTDQNHCARTLVLGAWLWAVVSRFTLFPACGHRAGHVRGLADSPCFNTSGVRQILICPSDLQNSTQLVTYIKLSRIRHKKQEPNRNIRVVPFPVHMSRKQSRPTSGHPLHYGYDNYDYDYD